jgi:hypothetical protein
MRTKTHSQFSFGQTKRTQKMTKHYYMLESMLTKKGLILALKEKYQLVFGIHN